MSSEGKWELSIFSVKDYGEFYCPNCDALLQDENIKVGKSYTCNSCGIKIIVVETKKEKVEWI